MGQYESKCCVTDFFKLAQKHLKKSMRGGGNSNGGALVYMHEHWVQSQNGGTDIKKLKHKGSHEEI